MKKRELLEPGYRAYNGHIFNEFDCNTYNRIQRRINAFILAGLPVSESLLNESHLTFKSITGIL